MRTLENRLAEAIRYEAERLPDEEAAHSLSPAQSRRSRFVRPGMAAPAAAVAVMILAAPVIWLSAGRGGGEPTPATSPTSQPDPAGTSQPVATTTPAIPVFGSLLGSVIEQLPDGFDPEKASPVFAMDASLEETANHYFEQRNLTTDVGIKQVEERDDYTLVQWAWGRLLDESEQEQGYSGWLLMRPTSRGYEILVATTDGVDLSDITISDGRLRGTIRSDTEGGMGVDVLDLDETPVASAPNPDGMPDADYLWGTAGATDGAGDPPLTLDLPVTQPVILRVNRVGGALLSISEVILGRSDNDTASTTPESDLRARTGRFGTGGEEGFGEWIRLDAPDAPDVILEMAGGIELPPGHTFDRMIENLPEEPTEQTEEGVMSTLEFEAGCIWTGYWLDAVDSGDTVARDRAQAVLDEIPTWPALNATDGGGTVDAWTRNAEVAAAGDVQGVLENLYTANCTGVVPGQ